MQRTIGGVKDPKAWMKDGALKGHFVNGIFADGMEFSILVMGDKAKAEETVTQLRTLVGKPNDFEGEERTTPNGTKQLSLKNWPGKPAAPAGGGGGGFRGGGGYKESYAQSKEAHDATIASIQRQKALSEAVNVSIAQKLFSPETILDTAQKFVNFLTCQHTPVAGTATTGQSSKPQAQAGDLDFSQFQGTLKAVNQHRKEAGKPVANLDTMREACLFRGWPDGFNSSGEMQAALGPERFRKLTKEMDKNALAFEQEEIVSVGE